LAATAILYDVHGNLPALEAVLADARGADSYVLGGDYALFGPFPADAVAALQALPNATWIRGNVERWTAHPDQAPEDELVQEAIEACRAALDARSVAELDALPEQLVIDGVRYCHASPLSDMRSFMPEPTDDEDELLAGTREQRLIFGHTHLQFRRTRSDGVELLNPGSVGLPMDGDPRAAYAFVDGEGEVELRRVEYDRDQAIAGLRERYGDAPWAKRSLRRIEKAEP
jgi:predicted phosphodiesterase